MSSPKLDGTSDWLLAASISSSASASESTLPGRSAELRARFVPALVHVKVARLGIYGFQGKRTLQPLNATSARFHWSELTDEITVAHAHIDDLLVWSARRTEQVVP